MRDINNLMPKIPGMKWGVLTNAYPTIDKINEINRTIAHDGKWHTIFEEADQIHVDGKRIWKKKLEQMT